MFPPAPYVPRRQSRINETRINVVTTRAVANNSVCRHLAVGRKQRISGLFSKNGPKRLYGSYICVYVRFDNIRCRHIRIESYVKMV